MDRLGSHGKWSRSVGLTVSITEAKRRLSQLLIEARKEPVVITRRGEPDSVILPYAEYVRLRRLDAVANIQRIAQELRGSGLSARELYEESRRELEERGG